MLLQGVLFRAVFCCLCHARMWVDVFFAALQQGESAPDLQTTFIMGHIVH